MSGPKSLSYRNRMAKRNEKAKRDIARKAATIRELKDEINDLGRKLDSTERKLLRLQKGAAA